MNVHHFPSQVPAGARINYIAVLSSLENYRLPTNNDISVEEVINRKIYAWYLQEHQENILQLDDVGWFLSYE
jgi:hypothetical protein